MRRSYGLHARVERAPFHGYAVGLRTDHYNTPSTGLDLWSVEENRIMYTSRALWGEGKGAWSAMEDEVETRWSNNQIC